MSPMKIVLAPDSFKESMTATEAVAAMRAGVHAVIPDAECVGVPMADGGEGTVDAVVDALHGQHVEVRGLRSRSAGRQRTIRLRSATPAGRHRDGGGVRTGTHPAGSARRAARQHLRRRTTHLLRAGPRGGAVADRTGRIGHQRRRRRHAHRPRRVFIDADGTPLGPGGAALRAPRPHRRVRP